MKIKELLVLSQLTCMYYLEPQKPFPDTNISLFGQILSGVSVVHESNTSFLLQWGSDLKYVSSDRRNAFTFFLKRICLKCMQNLSFFFKRQISSTTLYIDVPVVHLSEVVNPKLFTENMKVQMDLAPSAKKFRHNRIFQDRISP